ncbi:hypothetical protein SAMN03159443_05880 [Pseudomonas sp. NFACC15-1]|uniref:hypothetical protein n=1 Tax=unclassified Pseudomonas TaxID=196821 RepID=UPI0008858568|nr:MULTISPECIES: hypothetical protein [unclassified Pseudomonas]SDA97272.1 hypothetical protein SAMN03159443_05880 [Pseudomonas sp. NFACC15-1]SDZ28774.1 hypothetical protein SAMN03159380_05954 [Pseudomonas sp. NFACC14]
MESNAALEIEMAAYDEFLVQWNQDAFPQQRLGQAFYNFFNLHKLTDQTLLTGLYEADGKKATALISRIFKIR